MIKKGLTSFDLKCIAVISMTIDHTGAVLFPSEYWLRCLGRIAFPIFCFLIVEGFYHTRNLNRYLWRIGIFAFLSEIPFDLAFNGNCLEFEHQNVFFTLFLSVVMMTVLERCGEWPEKAAVLLIAMWLSVVGRFDYSYRGILLVFVFYVFRENRRVSVVMGALWNLLYQGTVQIFGMLAMIPIALYNGKPGKRMKYFFYVFYPLHLTILYLAALCFKMQ